MNRLHRAAAMVLLALFFLVGLPAQAAGPNTLSYQGQLTSGAGVPVNATISMTFTLYNASGTVLWSEAQSVEVSNGRYNAVLGQGATPLSPTLFDAPLFLGITVGSDAEMTPRVALTSVPYAFQAGGCSSGFTNCSGTCSSLSSDLNNCGACGTACPGGQVCSGGTCSLVCTGGTTKCANACTNTSLDPSNCGACGTVCSGGQVCSGSTCTLSCAGGTTKCGNACTNTTLDPSNCGGCAVACPIGQVCSAGSCTLSCAGGTTKCNNACTNTIFDPNNCGGCNIACGPGKACVNSSCQP